MFLEYIHILGSIILLTILEILLSIDNIIFINISCENLKGKKKVVTKQVGIILAILGRITLLVSINWLTKLNKPLFHIYTFAVSIKDCVILAGGLYLTYFAFIKLFFNSSHSHQSTTTSSFWVIIFSVIFFDCVCSFDSVLAAIAVGYNLTVMIISVIIACIVLAISMNPIGKFIDNHPNIKVLALSFLLLIGITLILNGFHYYVNNMVIAICIAFGAFIQFITLKNNKKL